MLHFIRLCDIKSVFLVVARSPQVHQHLCNNLSPHCPIWMPCYSGASPLKAPKWRKCMCTNGKLKSRWANEALWDKTVDTQSMWPASLWHTSTKPSGARKVIQTLELRCCLPFRLISYLNSWGLFHLSPPLGTFTLVESSEGPWKLRLIPPTRPTVSSRCYLQEEVPESTSQVQSN